MAEIAKISLSGTTYSLKDSASRNGDYNVRKFNSVSHMVSTSSKDINDNGLLLTGGYYAQGDGGGALYYSRAKASGETANNVTTYQPSRTAKIIELCDKDKINVKQLGAYGDNTNDDTTAIQNAVDYFDTVIIPTGTYKVTNTINISSKVKIISDNATFVGAGSASTNILNITADGCEINGLNIKGIGQYGINLDADKCLIENGTIEDLTYSGIMNLGANNTISNITGKNLGWDCVSNYGDAKNTLIKNCKAITCKRHGFSTDPSVSGIVFENCYAENIGNPSLNEGHSSYHFEGCSDCKLLNCKAIYDTNHPANSASSANSEYWGVRFYGVSGVTVDGLTVEYVYGFNPQNQSFALGASNSSYREDNITITNSYFINNSTSANVGSMYIASSKPSMYKTYLKDVNIIQQDSYTGYFKRIVDCDVVLNTKTYFLYYCYKAEDAEIIGCRFKGNLSLTHFLRGRFVNCRIENCTFDTGIDSIMFDSETGNTSAKSSNTIVRGCTFKDLTRGIHIILVENMTNYIQDCLFTGVIGTVVQANYNSVKMTGCQKYSLSYTNLSAGNPYFDVFSDLKTTFDYQQLALNPSNAVYSISVDGSGNVIATAI